MIIDRRDLRLPVDPFELILAYRLDRYLPVADHIKPDHRVIGADIGPYDVKIRPLVTARPFS